MTEAYLNVSIPFDMEPSSTWEDVYKFITLIGEVRYLLYTRDVFYAKLAVLLNIDIVQRDIREEVINRANVDTIAFLLTVDSLKYTWDCDCILEALSLGREDVAMLLIQDGKLLKDTTSITYIIEASLKGGCGKVFMYLAERFPNSMPDNVGYYYVTCCSYGLPSIAAKIPELDPMSIGQHDVSTGADISLLCSLDPEDISEFITTGIYTEGLRERLRFDEGVYPMIRSGRGDIAYYLIRPGCEENMLYKSIVIALNNGMITEFSQLEPYISMGYITADKLLELMIPNYKSNLEIVKRLSMSLSNDQRISISQKALRVGNWKFSQAIVSV
jgi:hypothetical protein